MDGQPSDFLCVCVCVCVACKSQSNGLKKCIELGEEYVEQILSLVAVACFLPGRAKDLSAPPRSLFRGEKKVKLCNQA